MTSTEAYRRPSTRLAATLLALTAAAQGLPAVAQPDAVLRDFQPTSEYRLWVAGKEVPKAEVFDSQVAGAYLILSSAFASPVLVGKRSSTVESVDLMKVAKQSDGSVDLLADATLQPLGLARPENNYSEIVFQVEGREARLRLTPPLLGLHARADLLAHTPEYGRGAAAYKPDSVAINRLKGQGRTVRVKVFFGSWCPHCRQTLPHLLKIEEMLAGSKVTFEYYGLPRPPEAWKEPEGIKHNVKGVPTGIVYIDGREAGRLGANDWAKVESSLAELVTRAPAAAPK